MAYVNNKQLYNAYVAFNAAIVEADASGTARPPIPNEIAIAFTQIAAKLSGNYNFCNYSYKDDMIAAAIEQCVKKAYLFNPQKSQNPFAYYMQICWNAFIAVIKAEQKSTSIKAKLLRNTDIEAYVAQASSEGDEGGNMFVEFLRENDVFVDYIEQSKENKRLKEQQTGQLHPALRHKNLTPYKKGEKSQPQANEADENTVDLWNASEGSV